MLGGYGRIRWESLRDEYDYFHVSKVKLLQSLNERELGQMKKG